MAICNDISITLPIIYIPQPIHPRLTLSPSEIRNAIALETAKKIDITTLENSIYRPTVGKQNNYTRAKLDEFALQLGGTVRRDKEELILFIKNRIKEIFSNTNENELK